MKGEDYHSWKVLKKGHPVQNQICDICGCIKYYNYGVRRMVYSKSGFRTNDIPECIIKNPNEK